MTLIKAAYGIEPILEIRNDGFGLHRDRNPDRDWGEFRWSKIDSNHSHIREVELTDILKRILVEDIALYYKNKNIFDKLKEFDLLNF